MNLFKNDSVPNKGYNLPKWDITNSYRATAYGYMKREGVNKVTNINGKTYSISTIENAMLT